MHFKRAAVAASRRRGWKERTRRMKDWRQAGAAAAAGIATLEWKRLRRILGLNGWGEQLLYRMKTKAFSLYDPTQKRQGCPHRACVRIREVDVHHRFWTCPAASSLWAVFLSRWRTLGLPIDGDLETSAFALQLPAVPAGIWDYADALFPTLSPKAREATLQHLHHVAACCWRLGTALFFHGVWRWRVAYYDPLNNVEAAHHHALLIDRLRQGYRTIQHYLHDGTGTAGARRAAAIMCRALTANWAPSTGPPNSTNHRFLLFFDGGSRGNPGPGGSGAVVVRIGASIAEVAISWILSMSYAARTTTNNQAEYSGLLEGLRACQRGGWAPLHVIGDSMMIIRQQTGRKSPHAAHLAPLYHQSRRIADMLRVL